MGNQKYDAFLKVAETGSFKQAAHDLGYTQAGISYLVSTLERELDVPLFVRDYGGAHLTSDGADLLPWVQNVCNSERQLEMRLAELKHLERASCAWRRSRAPPSNGSPVSRSAFSHSIQASTCN